MEAHAKQPGVRELAALFGSIALFKGLDEAQRGVLARNARLLRHRSGEMIVRETDRARGFYLVASGRVKVFRISPDGREQTLYHFGPGEPFCLCALFEGKEHMANAAALEPSEVVFIPAENLQRMGGEEPSLLFNLLLLLARRLKDAMDMVEALSIRSLGERVALFLLKLPPERDGAAEGGAELVRLPMTHRELAKVVGASHEALSRSLRAMADEGVVRVEGRKVAVLDRAALMRLAGEAPRG